MPNIRIEVEPPRWPGACKEAQPAATRIPEAEHHPENDVSVVEKASFLASFGHLKGGVRETIFSVPIY